MAKGIIYVMTTSVSGLIKIGKTQSENYQERMRFLENNGYYNVSGLRRQFAIEVEDYSEKERLIHEVFQKHQVADSELFALDYELVDQLLLAFDGKVIFPEDSDKEKQFDEISRTRRSENRFSFYRKGIGDGEIITFRFDPNITAKVVGGREVEYNGSVYKLSPLTRVIMERLGRLNTSGAYQGSQYWDYKGERLAAIKDLS